MILSVTSRRRKPRRGVVSDPQFRAFVRTFGCVVCFGALVRDCGWPPVQHSRTECAHIGIRGLSQKCSDFDSAPLCAIEHHQVGPTSHHVLGKRFWAFHGLDRRAIIAELGRLYKLL